MNLQFLDFICGLMIQVGNYFKIRKNKLGWLISILCVFWWGYRGISLGLYSQSFWHLFSLCMSAYGFYSWSRCENKHG